MIQEQKEYLEELFEYIHDKSKPVLMPLLSESEINKVEEKLSIYK